MSERFYRIRGIDPLLFRDGRPFADDLGALSAQTLALPTSGTLAGMFRTRWGNAQKDWNWEHDWQKARRVPVWGPLLMLNSHPVIAAPADAIVYDYEPEQAGMPCENADTPAISRPETTEPHAEATKSQAGKECRVMALRPNMAHIGNANMPDGLAPLQITADVKPASGYNYWTWKNMTAWLLSPISAQFPIPAHIVGPLREERTHVKIKAETGASEEGKLFTTQSLCFAQYPRWNVEDDAQDEPGNSHNLRPCPDRDAKLQFGAAETEGREWELLARVGIDDDLTGSAPFGGERRLALIEDASQTVKFEDATNAQTGSESGFVIATNQSSREALWPPCPMQLTNALKASKKVRLLLATPALFDGGWKPGNLNADGTWTPPNAPGVKLKLVSAAIKRREPVSGWDYRIDSKSGKSLGPKRVRWMVPAGSVYFFEAQDGSEMTQLAAGGWLTPVSDQPQDRDDGYGLALWGVWEQLEKTADETTQEQTIEGETA